MFQVEEARRKCEGHVKCYGHEDDNCHKAPLASIEFERHSGRASCLVFVHLKALVDVKGSLESNMYVVSDVTWIRSWDLVMRCGLMTDVANESICSLESDRY